MGGGLVRGALQGVKELLGKLDSIDKGLMQEGASALYQEALVDMRQSMLDTPVEYGALRASHVTEPPEISKDDARVLIKVGGPAAPYAPIVHFDMEARHEVGKAMFLQDAVFEGAKTMPERMAKRISLIRAARG